MEPNADADEDVQYFGRMDMLVLWTCNDCGLTLSPWSKRHLEGENEDGETFQLDAACPVCRTNEWYQLNLIGVLTQPGDE